MNPIVIYSDVLNNARRYPHMIDGYTLYQLPSGAVSDSLKCQLHIAFGKFPYVEEPLTEEDATDILDNFWYSPVCLVNEAGEGYVTLPCWFSDMEDLKRYGQYYLSDIANGTVQPVSIQVTETV